MDLAPDHHTPAPATGDARYREVRKVTLIGSAVDLVLGVVKLIVGVIGSSQALVADGVHSLSDLATDFLVLFAAKHGSREADEEHPYGHARYETVMTVGLGAALIAVALGIAYDAVRRLFAPELLLHPGWMALIVAVLSILAKEAVYVYTIRVARKLRSKLLRANAWHSRSDAISSAVVVVGVLGSMAGLDYLDAIAAVGVAFMVAKIGWELAWHSVQELVDTALRPERIEAIRRVIMGVDGVQTMHMLRTRQMGGDALVDVHILVDPKVSVSEGHQIGETVRSRLIGDVPEVSDVTVHIDPEDDEFAAPCGHLPPRQALLARLQKRWKDIDAALQIESVTLHYLDGKVQVEATMPISAVRSVEQARELAATLARVGEQDEDVARVTVRFS
jgi:cation diffusion facilitator family transporter